MDEYDDIKIKKCILSCINLKNTCPTCNAPAKKEDLIPNFLVDQIINIVKTERSKEEYQNLELTFQKTQSNYKMNQVQNIFFENLKQIFNSYNSFMEKIDDETKRQVTEIDRLVLQSKDINSMNHIDLSKIIEMEKHKSYLLQKKENVIKDLALSLDKYMKNLPESPLLLPVKTKIFVEAKNVTIDHVSLMLTDSGQKLYDILKNYFNSLGDPIEDLGNNSDFIVVKKIYEDDMNSMVIEKEQVRVITKDSKILSSGITTGEIIIFRGNLICKSNAPKYCIKYKFEELNKNKVVNYFSCDKCGLNWICEVCAMTCHKDHPIKLFKDNHVAEWACCYCFKNKCLIKK